jgi:hypothetical protein
MQQAAPRTQCCVKIGQMPLVASKHGFSTDADDSLVLPRSIPETRSMSIVLTPFARTRLFPKESRRNTIRDCTPEQFERRLNDEVPLNVLDGYAPFCKLHVHRNWTSTRCLTVPITDDNRHLLRTGYEARTSEELPVLVRWFEGVEAPIANYLAVILYSREQLAKEGSPIDTDWGVVGCLYTAEPEEIPMAPITMMRNALGVEEGGSGVALDREAYRRSVVFWERNANWRP